MYEMSTMIAREKESLSVISAKDAKVKQYEKLLADIVKRIA